MQPKLDRKRIAVELLAAGYTTRYIVKKMIEAEVEPYAETDLVAFRQQYAPEIADLQEASDREVLNSGLSRRAERVRRLSHYVETLENVLDSAPEGQVPLKVGKEFRAAIKDIQEEVDPLGLRGLVDPNDPWVKHISLLISLRPDPQLPSNTPPLRLSESSSKTDTSVEQLSLGLDGKSLQEESVEVRVSTPRSS